MGLSTVGKLILMLDLPFHPPKFKAATGLWDDAVMEIPAAAPQLREFPHKSPAGFLAGCHLFNLTPEIFVTKMMQKKAFCPNSPVPRRQDFVLSRQRERFPRVSALL